MLIFREANARMKVAFFGSYGFVKRRDSVFWRGRNPFLFAFLHAKRPQTKFEHFVGRFVLSTRFASPPQVMCALAGGASLCKLMQESDVEPFKAGQGLFGHASQSVGERVSPPTGERRSALALWFRRVTLMPSIALDNVRQNAVVLDGQVRGVVIFSLALNRVLRAFYVIVNGPNTTGPFDVLGRRDFRSVGAPSARLDVQVVFGPMPSIGDRRLPR